MRNIVLICLDSVRKDFFDIYAPRLRTRADVSVDSCRAASSWSIPSHASMLTGEVPHRHGVHTHNRTYRDLTLDDTVFSHLPEHERLGVSSNVFASPAFGFDELFDEFHTVSSTRPFPPGNDPVQFVSSDQHPVKEQLSFLHRALRDTHPLRSLANAFLTYLDELTQRVPMPRLLDSGSKGMVRACEHAVNSANEPFVLFANFMEAHLPLEPTLGYDSTLHSAPYSFSTDDTSVWELMGAVDDHREYLRQRRGLYGASIAYLDRLLDDLVESMLNTEHETTIIITADHGENLGYPADGGLVRHKGSLSEGLLHVPFEMINPPHSTADSTGRYVSHLDFDTLLPALATERVPDLGRDGIPAEVVGMSAGAPPPSNSDYWDRMIRAVYKGPNKFVKDSLCHLREHEVDTERPNWQTPPKDITSAPVDWSEHFVQDITTAKRRAVEHGSASDATPSVKERLEDLGYA